MLPPKTRRATSNVEKAAAPVVYTLLAAILSLCGCGPSDVPDPNELPPNLNTNSTVPILDTNTNANTTDPFGGTGNTNSTGLTILPSINANQNASGGQTGTPTGGSPGAPTAVVSSDRETGHAGEPVRFDGSGSTDGDGRIVSFAWDFGDGTSSTERSPSHTFADNGTHAVTLTVTDDGGNRITARRDFVIRPFWTYAVYMAADNNLAVDGLLDLMEMETVGSTPQMKVVVQAEFSPRYLQQSNLTQPQQIGLQTFGTSRFVIKRDASPNERIDTPQQPIGERVMSSPEALTEFIRFVAESHPADHVALVLWNHGGGWQGVCEDETANRDYLMLPEVTAALAQAGVKIDVLNFDACLMAMHEVAYSVAGHADFMVASEETEPGAGDPYDLILGDIAANPAISPRELAQRIPSRFKQSYVQAPANGSESATKSALDLSKFMALDAALGGLADVLRAGLPNERAAIEQARQATQAYKLNGSHDLGRFAENLRGATASAEVRAACDQVLARLGEVVIANEFHSGSRTGQQPSPNVSGSTGLAVIVPQASDFGANGPTSFESYRQFAGEAMHPSWLGLLGDLLNGDATTPQSVGEANFGIAIVWDDPNADVDLYVIEPDDAFHAPWMGSVTPNGFFGGDSSATGQLVEVYNSRPSIARGRYDFVANLYSSSNLFVDVEVYFFDLQAGVNDWTLLDTITLSPLSPAPLDWFEHEQDINALLDNQFSDWNVFATLNN